MRAVRGPDLLSLILLLTDTPYSLSLPDLDSKAAQKASSVAPRAFTKALAVCRTLVQTSGSARNSPRRRAVTFQTLAGEIVREDVPQEVLGWATTVRQLLADESGENVDGEEALRGIWGWVLEAWGVSRLCRSVHGQY